MKRYTTTIVSLVLIGLCGSAHADGANPDDVLTIDETAPPGHDYHFPDTDALTPKAGEFEIVSSVFMSSKSGQRWATLTLKNTSAHQRLLDREHIVGLFADGSTRHPETAERKFSGHEQITLTLYFGISKFPLLSIQTAD